MKVVIVIPTYIEKENIAKLIPNIESSLGGLKQQFDILIVDDNSPDGTAQVVKNLATKFTNLYLLSGSKKGLGSAYIRGFKFAIEKLKADIIIQMDADFSHNPKDIVRLTEGLHKGFDVVIGSRYVTDGEIKDWSFFRKALSAAGNFICRKALNLNNIKDCTSGFRAIRVKTISKINFENFKTNGYSFQVKLLYELQKAGAKVKEIPIKFIDRKTGATKLGFWDIIEGISTLIKIKVSR